MSISRYICKSKYLNERYSSFPNTLVVEIDFVFLSITYSVCDQKTTHMSITYTVGIYFFFFNGKFTEKNTTVYFFSLIFIKAIGT